MDPVDIQWLIHKSFKNGLQNAISFLPLSVGPSN